LIDLLNGFANFIFSHTASLPLHAATDPIYF
jgi:hypothetical protein